MADAGNVFGICEACHAPRSEQDMICGKCGYVFKTKPVPAYPGERAATTRRTDPPTIHEPPPTNPTSSPPMTERMPPPQAPPVQPTMRSPWAPSEDAPRTLHSPSSPPVGDPRQAVPVATFTPPPLPPPPSAVLRPAGPSPVPWVLGAVALIVVAAAAVLVLAMGQKKRGPHFAKRARAVNWDGTAGASVGHLDASPAEDFVGRYMELDGTSMATWVGAFSGDDMRELWRAGPFELPSGTHPPVPFAVLGSHVLVGDPRAVLHVYDGATGRETHLIELGDRATRIRVDGDKDAYIEVANGANVLYDAALARAKVTPPPPWAAAGPQYCGVGPASRSLCLDARRAAKFGGFAPRYAVASGELGIAVGRTPAAPTLNLVAFTLATGAERWRAPVSADSHYAPDDEEIVEIDGANVFATWGIASSTHVVALAAKDGARLWDAALPKSGLPMGPRSIIVSPTRVYLPRPSRLDILDRATGKHVGAVGAL